MGVNQDHIAFDTVEIPWTPSTADAASGLTRDNVMVWTLRKEVLEKGPLPTILLVAGLDLNMADQLDHIHPLVQQGWAVIAVDMPGTGKSPLSGRFTNMGNDRPMWDAVVKYVHSRPDLFDAKQLHALGVSTGGYWSNKLAHTHAHVFASVVSRGGASHYTFQPDWLAASTTLSYPCNLPKALGLAFGYNDTQEFINHAQRYSLYEQNLLGVVPTTKLLAITGTEDLVFPVDDSLMFTEYSTPTVNLTMRTAAPAPQLRLFPGLDHNAELQGLIYVNAYFEQLLAQLGKGQKTSK